MRRKHYIMSSGLLIIGLALVLYRREQPEGSLLLDDTPEMAGVGQEIAVENETIESTQSQSTPEEGCAEGIGQHADECYAKLWKERDRLTQVMFALGVKYENSLLVKYANLNLTQEERSLRIMELKKGGEEARKEAQELADLDFALYNAKPLPLGAIGHKDGFLVLPDTEDIREIKRINSELAAAISWRQSAMINIEEVEIRVAPDTKEYQNLRGELYILVSQPEPTDKDKGRMKQLVSEIHEMAKTSTPTSVFQMPP